MRVEENTISCVVPDLRVSGQFEGIKECNSSGSLDSQYQWTSLISQGKAFVKTFSCQTHMPLSTFRSLIFFSILQNLDVKLKYYNLEWLTIKPVKNMYIILME